MQSGIWKISDGVNVTLADAKLRVGDSLRLMVRKPVGRGLCLSVLLFEIKPTLSMFAMQTTRSVEAKETDALVEISLEDRPAGPYALFVSEAPEGGQAIHNRFPSEDFAPIWIAEQTWPTDLMSAVSQRLNEQAEYCKRPILFPAYAGARAFELYVLLQGCLLDHPQPIEGGELIPLREAVGPDSLLATINSIFNSDFALGEEGRRRFSSGHPLVAVKFSQVRAPNESAAFAAVSGRVHLISNLMAMDRGSASVAVASVAVDLKTRVPSFSLAEKPYYGNLIGGFFAGALTENVDLFLRATSRNPWLGLIVGMFGEALAEPNPLFGVVKLWATMEACAKRSRRREAGRPSYGRVTGDLAVVCEFALETVGLKGIRYDAKCDNVSVLEHFYRVRNIGAHEGVVNTRTLTAAQMESLEFVLGNGMGLRALRDMVQSVLTFEAIRAGG